MEGDCKKDPRKVTTESPGPEVGILRRLVSRHVDRCYSRKNLLTNINWKNKKLTKLIYLLEDFPEP